MTSRTCAFGSIFYTKSRKNPNHATEAERLTSFIESKENLYNKYFDDNKFFLEYNLIGE